MLRLNELSNLKGRNAIVTGASGNLGAVIANTLAELGANLILTDQKTANLEQLKQEIIKKWKINVVYMHCDLELQEERNELIEWVKSNFKVIDILINNAAFVGSSNLKGWNEDFESQSVETWRRAMEVNVTAAFELCQKLLHLLRKSQSASIINIGSIYGVNGPDWRLYENINMANPAAYASSKAALIQLTRWLATTISPEFRVNSISPGGIKRGQSEEFIQRYEKKTPLGRMASEDDFRGAIAFFSTDLSAYVTGQNLLVDGGWGVW